MALPSVNDVMTRAGRIRDVNVCRVKSPAQATGERDRHTLLFTIPGAEAFSPPHPACKLVETSK